MDTKLLLDIFHIPALSNKEEEISKFVIQWLIENKVDYNIDAKSGTIYNLDNDNKPLLACHLDTVQDEIDAMLTKYIKIKNGILKGYGVIGGDDKCGIFIILELLKKYPTINFCFFPAEEVGCKGSRAFVETIKDFSKVLYGIVIDRRFGGDIICTNNSYGTLAFEDELVKIGKEFNYKVSTGTVSDANTLKDFISCANLSCAYYNPHSKKEYVVIKELENTTNYIEKIITTLTTRFDKPIVKDHSKGKSYKNGEYGYYGEYGYPDEFGNDYKAKTYKSPYKCDCCSVYGIKQTKYIKAISKQLCETCILKLYYEISDIDFEEPKKVESNLEEQIEALMEI